MSVANEISGFEGFFEIPGYSGYAIDKQGNLLRLKDKKLLRWHSTKGVLKKRIVGGYRRRRILLENGSRTSLARHRALCLAFKPIENPDEMLVNHINGIPGDDRLENLEWVTYSENTQHAYDNGLHSAKIRPVLMWNLATGDVVRFPSLVACYKAIGKTEKYIRNRLDPSNQSKRYPDKLRFKYDDDTPWPELEPEFTNSKRSKFVMAKCVHTGKIDIVESITEASYLYGIPAGSIATHVSRNSFTPLHGYVFREAAHDVDWPVYTEHQLELFKAHPVKPPRGVLIRWVDTGEEELFFGVDEAAKALNKGPLVISRLCISGKVHHKDRFECEYIYPDRQMTDV